MCLVVVVCVIVLFQVGDLGSLFCKRLELSQKRQRVCLFIFYIFVSLHLSGFIYAYLKNILL